MFTEDEVITTQEKWQKEFSEFLEGLMVSVGTLLESSEQTLYTTQHREMQEVQVTSDEEVYNPLIGQDIAPEVRRGVKSALQGRQYKAFQLGSPRLDSKTVMKEVVYEQENRGVPQLEVVVFMHADVATLVSKEQTDRTLEKLQQVADSFAKIQQKYGDAVPGISFRVLCKTKYVSGTEINSLQEMDQGHDSFSTTSATELAALLEKIPSFYRKQLQQTVHFPATTVVAQDISAQAELANSASRAFREWMFKSFVLTPAAIGQQAHGYFPATMVIDIGGQAQRVTNIPGAIV